MNNEQIRQLFLQAYHEKKIIECQLIPDPPRKYAFKIYYLMFLKQLAAEVQTNSFSDKQYAKSDDDFTHNYGARFIVDLGKTIKFSREGMRSSSVPAHTDMANRVLTAGNIYFSEDYTKIVGISNKSGHFKPDFSSLVFAIPLILNSQFPLAESIELINEKTQESIMLSTDELMSLLPDELLENMDTLMEDNQSEEPFFEYKSYQHESSSSAGAIPYCSIFSNSEKYLDDLISLLSEEYDASARDAHSYFSLFEDVQYSADKVDHLLELISDEYESKRRKF